MAERFINAARCGLIDHLREATRRDLNTGDEDGMTATLWAASGGSLEALRLIAGREGDVNKADIHGMTCLHHACLRGHFDVVSFLVNWGCNVFALDNEMLSALDIAHAYKRADIVRYLDGEIAWMERKNPRQAVRLRQKAVKIAEQNRRKFDEMVMRAHKLARKEQKSGRKTPGQGSLSYRTNIKIKRHISEPNLIDAINKDEKILSMSARPSFGTRSRQTVVESILSLDPAGDAIEHEDSIKSNSTMQGRNMHEDSVTPFDEDDLEDDESSSVQGEFSAVETFLSVAGLADHLNVFTQEKIDFELLVNMSDSALKDVGLRLGPRIKLEGAIKRRKKVLSTPAAMTDSYP